MTRATANTFFAICNGCFWCASLLGARSVVACPSCRSALIEVLPLCSNEAYTFDYKFDTGVTLEFLPKAHAHVA
ncbi:MAG: hypothetical protein ABI347_00650 [Nitrososphaera sp.]